MIPMGYLYKTIKARPAWLQAGAVSDVCSVSNCISEAFADYVNFWEHNGYWLFDSPAIMDRIAAKEGIDLSGTTLFYYEAHDEEFHDPAKLWRKFDPEGSFATNVEEPRSKRCLGYDVVTFFAGAGPECSPLSCNSMANTVPVNAHCLFESFTEAKAAVDSGTFTNTEPGPFRIFAVHVIDR